MGARGTRRSRVVSRAGIARRRAVVALPVAIVCGLVLSSCAGNAAPMIDGAALPWPAEPAALGYANGTDIVTNTDEPDEPQEIASLAKVISALVVLEEHPLRVDEAGAVHVVNGGDLAVTAQVHAADGVAVPVYIGSEVTQRELLNGSLVGSASNYSTMLVQQTFGSMANYLTAADEWLHAHELDHTTVTDASGLDGGARGSVNDMVRLGRLALADPVVAEIVAMPVAPTGNGGSIANTNELLSVGFTGIKTGTDARSHLLFSRPDGDEVLVGVVLGADSAAFARRWAVQLTDAVIVSE